MERRALDGAELVGIAGGTSAPEETAQPSLEVRQLDGSAPLSDELAAIVFPLVRTIVTSLNADAAVLMLPAPISEGPAGEDRAVILQALVPDVAHPDLAELLVQQAPGLRREAADRKGSAQLSLQSAEWSQPVPGAARPVPFDGDDGPALLVVAGAGLDALADGWPEPAESLIESLAGTLRSHHRHWRRHRGAAALLEVARTAGSTLQLEEVLSLVTERTARLVGADRCGLWLLGKDGYTLVPSALYGMSPDYLPTWKEFRTTLDAEPLSKEAIESARAVLVADAPNDPRTDKAAVHFFGDKTILVLPLMAKGQVQGSLFINHVRSHHRYTASEIETAMAIANQAAIAVQNAKLYRQVEEWGSQLERLQSIMSKLSRSRSVSSIANVIADELRNLIRYDTCRVWVVMEDSSELAPLATFSSSHEYVVDAAKLENLRIEMGQGITGYVAATGVPTIVGDVERDPRSYHVPETLVLDESMIATPINFEGRVIGVITLSRLGLSQFSEDDLRLLGLFANEAAIEFENARLHQETQKKSRELLASFQRVGVALSTGLDPAHTLRIITDLAAEMVKARACAILLVDASDGELLFKASTGLAAEFIGSGHVHAEHDLSWEVVQTGAPRLVPDLSASERPDWMGPEDGGLHSYLGVPLMMQNRVIGVLAVFGGRVGQFHQTDVELLSSFAHQAAIAIQNAQLFSSLQERVRELTGLAEVSRVTTSLTKLHDTFREVARAIARLLQAEKCVLLLADGEGRLVPQRPAFGFKGRELSQFKLRTEGFGDAAASTHSMQSVDGTAVTCEGACEMGHHLLAPMRAQDKPIGMVLVSGRPDPGFTADDVRLLTILSATAAVIVQNAILYQSVDREREELDAIISKTSDAIIIVDHESRVTRMNAAAERLTGWSAEEVVGSTCDDSVLGAMPLDPERAKTCISLRDVIQRRESIPYFETVVVTRDGVKRDVAASYSYVQSAGRGEGLGVIIGRDISQQREVERMKSEFVSMVSHELRTPLGLIKGYASTLVNPQMKVDEATTRRFLMGIDGAADRLTRLIENLLSVSRIEAGQLRISPHPVDLTRIVAASVDLARTSSKGNQDIEVVVPDGPVIVEGDRVQLELVVDNLLANAIKYSPLGRPIRLEMRMLDSEAEVRVIDQGIGIAAHHLPKVFDRFYRVEGGYTRKTPGSGLGLYICRNIIDAHGGRIWGKSKLGEGSTFGFTVPLARKSEDDEPPTPPVRSESRGGAADG
jgi:PAS domain S-box-containing protein